ncbi:MAG: hypothetical protein ABI442_16385 [Gemmatimonadaceae bacterium]
MLGATVELFLLALPIACVSWTVTHEEVFRAPREWCGRQSRDCRRPLARKFFYLFTCEYCFSHYVTAFFLGVTGFTLLLPGWRGYLISGFALVWIANMYMGLFGRLRLDIKYEGAEIAREQAVIVGAESASPRLPDELATQRPAIVPKRSRPS